MARMGVASSLIFQNRAGASWVQLDSVGFSWLQLEIVGLMNGYWIGMGVGYLVQYSNISLGKGRA